MVYNDTTGGQGIVQDTYFEASANSSSYPIADLTRNSNVALDNVTSLALLADAKWDYDSSNQTDLPIGIADLIANQQDYEFDDEFLIVKSVEICDTNGKWSRLVPIDNLSLEERQSLTDFMNVAGTPQYYDKVGNSVFLFPAPNYNKRLVEEGTGGLKVYFQRKNDYFTVSDTNKEPGFAKHLHKYIPLYNAYVYACAKELPKQNSLKTRLEFYEGNKLRGGNDDGAIMKHYSKRERDNQQRITSEEIYSI